MLVNNNNLTELIYKCAFVGLSYTSIKYSLMHVCGTYNRPSVS
jgi:hypothetical protein